MRDKGNQNMCRFLASGTRWTAMPFTEVGNVGKSRPVIDVMFSPLSLNAKQVNLKSFAYDLNREYFLKLKRISP